MVFIILIIPIAISIFLYFFFNEVTTWREHCLLIIPSILCLFIIKYLLIYSEETDTEYIGKYITKVTCYQSWNEHSGQRTHEYPEQFTYTLNTGEEEITTAEDFYNIKRHWNSKTIFRDLHKDDKTKDGYAFDTKWDGRKLTCESRTFEETYKNKVRASHSIFKSENISEIDAKKIGLYDYPKRDIYYERQEQVLGLKKKDRAGVQMIEYINGVYGYKNKFRTYILMFYNKSINVAQKQREYWEGGNKNEFIVCVGVDSVTNKIQWCYPFSWQDTPLLETKTKQVLIPGSKFSLYKYACWLDKNVSENWQRKSFDSFDYINMDLSNSQYMSLLEIIISCDILLSLCIIFSPVIFGKMNITV